MLERLREGYSTMTDLADTIVRLHGVGFRQAHDVVVEVTLAAVREGVRAEDISTGMVEEASMKVLGRLLTVTANDLKQALDPVNNVKRRSLPGGPAPRAVKAMIAEQRKLLRGERKRRRARLEALERAKVKLGEAEKTLLR
jgi:argininosuccinate lyase